MPLIAPDVAEFDLDIPAGDDYALEILSVADDSGAPINFTGSTFVMTLFNKGVAVGAVTPTFTAVALATGNFRFNIARAQTDASVLPFSGEYRIDQYAPDGNHYPFARGAFYRS